MRTSIKKAALKTDDRMKRSYYIYDAVRRISLRFNWPNRMRCKNHLNRAFRKHWKDVTGEDYRGAFDFFSVICDHKRKFNPEFIAREQEMKEQDIQRKRDREVSKVSV